MRTFLVAAHRNAWGVSIYLKPLCKSEKSKVIVFSLPLGKVKSSSRQPGLYLIGAAGYDQLRMSI